MYNAHFDISDPFGLTRIQRCLYEYSLLSESLEDMDRDYRNRFETQSRVVDTAVSRWKCCEEENRKLREMIYSGDDVRRQLTEKLRAANETIASERAKFDDKYDLAIEQIKGLRKELTDIYDDHDRLLKELAAMEKKAG